MSQQHHWADAGCLDDRHRVVGQFVMAEVRARTPESPCPRQSGLMTRCRAARRSASKAKKLRPLLHHPGRKTTASSARAPSSW